MFANLGSSMTPPHMTPPHSGLQNGLPNGQQQCGSLSGSGPGSGLGASGLGPSGSSGSGGGGGGSGGGGGGGIQTGAMQGPGGFHNFGYPGSGYNALTQIKRQTQSLSDDVSSGYGSPSPSSL